MGDVPPVAMRRRQPRNDDDEVLRAQIATVHRFLRSQVGFDLGEELTARTVVEAWARRSAFDPDRGTKVAWLLGIAVNVLRHHIRDESRRERAYLALAAQSRLMDPSDAPLEEVLEAMAAVDHAAAVQAALQRVDHVDREVLLLAAQPGATYRDMAEQIGIPVGTLRSRLSGARRRLASAVNALQGQS